MFFWTNYVDLWPTKNNIGRSKGNTFFFPTKPGRSKVTTFHARWWPLTYLKRLFLQNRAFSKKKKEGQRSTQVGQRSPNWVFWAKIIWYYKFQEKQLGRSKVTTHPTTTTPTPTPIPIPTARATRRRPDYSSNPCPPQNSAIWLFLGQFWFSCVFLPFPFLH